MPTPPTNRCVLVAPTPTTRSSVRAARQPYSSHRASTWCWSPSPTAKTATLTDRPNCVAAVPWSRPPRRHSLGSASPLRTLRLGHPDGTHSRTSSDSRTPGVWQTGDLVRLPGPTMATPIMTVGPAATAAASRRVAQPAAGISCGPGIGPTPTRISRGATVCESTSDRWWPAANAGRLALLHHPGDWPSRAGPAAAVSIISLDRSTTGNPAGGRGQEDLSNTTCGGARMLVDRNHSFG